MPYPLPPTISPTRVTAFTDCALAFRFSVLDQLPEPPSAAATKGTLVHAALEALFTRSPGERTLDVALADLAAAAERLRDDPEFAGLGLDADAEAMFVSDAERFVRGYFALENPAAVHPVGLELRLEADVGGVTLRGVIDRLDRRPDGSFVVTDYKTGRAPGERYEQSKLVGVDVYALLCERVFGVRPAAVRLLYLGEPLAITCTPSDRSSRFTEQKVGAVWQTIQRANAADAFKPKPGRLCDWCSYREWCPAFGGDPEEARRLGELRRADRRAEREGLAKLPGLVDDVVLPAAG